jgi:hypothetical protein
MGTPRKKTKPGADQGKEKKNAGQASELMSLAPLQIIRTETVISRMPIHNLVKGGEVNIQISQKNEQGRVTLHWEISPSNRFGHPGQLAYKIDTTIINRIIDEIGRPVPRLIKIGTLNQLCQELGSQKAELKKSLQQNASTTIVAKLHYKSNDGKERKLEATFSRYSVVFTGETLPTGEKADEIYVIFNDPYLEVLNSAPIRPLNYDYLKELAPTSQRFYEIISYRIYAAIKYRYPQAKLLYSEYCTYSAQRRHDDFERVRVQMYRVHKPHLESSYINKVEFEHCTDEEGKPDWVIYYTPGPKAKAEFQTFNSRQLAGAAAEMESLPPAGVESGEIISEKAQQPTSEQERTTEIELVKYFHLQARGKKDLIPDSSSKEISQAAGLLVKHDLETAKFIVDFAVKEARKTNFQMRTFGAILQYVADAEAAREQWLSSRGSGPVSAATDDDPYLQEIEAHRRAEERLDALSNEEYESLHEKVKTELKQRYPEIIQKFDAESMESTIRAGMLKILRENVGVE